MQGPGDNPSTYPQKVKSFFVTFLTLHLSSNPITHPMNPTLWTPVILLVSNEEGFPQNNENRKDSHTLTINMI